MSRAIARPSRRLVLAGAGATVLARAARAQTGARDITIPVSSFSFATAGVRAAQLLGVFSNNGLNPKIVNMDSANAATAALIGGSVEVVVSGPGELVAANARGQNVVVVANTYRGFGGSLILSKAAAASTGIDPSAPPAERFKALDGLVIASATPTSGYTASFKGAAEAYGAKIRFTYMAQQPMIAALESGAVKGMIASAPYWDFPVARGTGVLWLSGPKGELPDRNTPGSSDDIQAMRPFAEANPALMRQLIDTLRDFTSLLQTKPDEVKAAVAKLYPDIDPATMDVLFATESRAWIWRPSTPIDMQHEIDFVRFSGISLPGLDRIDAARMLYVPPGAG
jgi:ABC-type nitrate/sulfonate/bicarbonate transport system substrate-binding protein